MKAKTWDSNKQSEGKKEQYPVRRSSRLKPWTLSNVPRTKTVTKLTKDTKFKVQKGLQHADESVVKRRKWPEVTDITQKTKQKKQEHLAKQSKYASKENPRKQLLNTTVRKRTTKDQASGIKMSRTLKQKPNRINNAHTSKPKDAEQNCSRNENRKGNFQLIKTITIEQNYYENANITRYSDVAFLGDNHILALDDNYFKRTQGQRICCINIDGTLVCDLPVPGYPWSVVILSPTEAVVTMGGQDSFGLLWLSIDIYNKTMEVTRTIPFETEVSGLSYSDRSQTLIASYNKQPFMSVINREGVEKRKIRCKTGLHYRCLVLEDDTIMFLDHQAHKVSIMNQRGKVLSTLKHKLIENPNSLCSDCFGNIYVGCFRSGDLLKFDTNGEHLKTFKCSPRLCAIGLDRTSERMVTASDNTISIYALDKNI